MALSVIKFVFIGGIIAALVTAVIYYVIISFRIHRNGVETDAVISRIKIDTDADDDIVKTYYVTYRNDDGEAVEALLGNPRHNMTQGVRLRVKYLPEKPKHVVLAKR